MMSATEMPATAAKACAQTTTANAVMYITNIYLGCAVSSKNELLASIGTNLMQSANILEAMIRELPVELFRAEFLRRCLPSCARGVLRAISREFREAVAAANELVRVNVPYKFADWCLSWDAEFPDSSSSITINDLFTEESAGQFQSLVEYFDCGAPPTLREVALRRGRMDYYDGHLMVLAVKHCLRATPEQCKMLTGDIPLEVAFRRNNVAVLTYFGNTPTIRPVPTLYMSGYYDRACRLFNADTRCHIAPFFAYNSTATLLRYLTKYTSNDAQRLCRYILTTHVVRWELVDAVAREIPGYFDGYLAAVPFTILKHITLEYVKEFCARPFLPRVKFLELALTSPQGSGCYPKDEFCEWVRHAATEWLDIPRDAITAVYPEAI
jgi:hypothetical protein